MKNISIILLTFLMVTLVYAQPNNLNIKHYSKVKIISELEWRLVQVNLKLGKEGYYVFFDNASGVFRVDKFIDTHTLITTNTSTLRDILSSACILVEAVIGSEFQEFRESNPKSLNIAFIIGEEGARCFANYSSGKLSFTDEYYSFKKENEQ
jgi:hypothetical protein